MKIGVSYNLFDGEELLEDSIKSIRKNVDYISVIYQEISNFGDECSVNLVSLLNELKKNGLVNEIHKYNPNLKVGGSWNEITKRNLGLYLSKNNNCTHHMAMDSDEFYTDEQFKYLKKVMVDGDYDSSCCQMVTYYKEPIYRLEPKEEYYVSLLFKIVENKEYVLGHSFPVLVDPTRRMKTNKCKIFTRDEIEMHHLSYIRHNIRKKLENSSAVVNFKDKVDELTKYYNNWVYPKDALMAGSPNRYHKIVKTENLFNLWK